MKVVIQALRSFTVSVAKFLVKLTLGWGWGQGLKVIGGQGMDNY